MVRNTKIYICQICGNPKLFINMNVCIMCGKHVCDDCAHHDYREKMRTNYPETYCEECWDIGKPYRVLINKAELELDIKKEGIRSDWYDEINGIKLERIPTIIMNATHRYKVSCKYGSIKYHVPNTLSVDELESYHSIYKKQLYDRYIFRNLRS